MNEHLSVKKFLAKHSIRSQDIMYILREDRKSAMYLNDGRVISTFHPLKSIVEAYDNNLRIINKGIAIAPEYVRKVEENVYTTSDGREFSGRVGTLREHKAIAETCKEKANQSDWDMNQIFYDMPYAMCIIELVFDGSNKGIDFIFRYCNKAMEELEGKTLDEMLDKSFYEIFQNADPKWLLAYADIAANGGSIVIESYSPEVNANLRIYCFQPKPSFCACILVKLTGNSHGVRQLS